MKHRHTKIEIHEPGTIGNLCGPPGWYAVSCSKCSIFAYTANEADAEIVKRSYTRRDSGRKGV